MFTRVVEITANPGKARDLSRTISDKVLPLLKNQPGFVDEIVLVSDATPERILAMSFWRTKEDAEKYNKEQFPRVNEMIRNLVTSTPQVTTFTVDHSTTHKIASGKAA